MEKDWVFKEKAKFKAQLLLIDFAPLWLDEVKGVPLGLFLLFISIAGTSSITFAESQLAAIQVPATIPETVVKALLDAILLGAIGFIGWWFVDKMGWAERRTIIDVHTKEIGEIKEELKGLLTKEAHTEFKEHMEANHRELKTLIQSLGDRVYNIAVAGVSRGDLKRCPILEGGERGNK